MLNSSFTGSKIGVSWPNVKDDISSYITLPPSSLPKFSVKRYTTGFGQERGGLAIDLYNRHATPKRFRLYQVVPWYLKFYLHTLKINSTTAAEFVSFVDSGTSSWSANPTDVVIDTYYQPTIARGRPTVLEMEVHLPVGKTSLHIDFEKSFIRCAHNCVCVSDILDTPSIPPTPTEASIWDPWLLLGWKTGTSFTLQIC